MKRLWPIALAFIVASSPANAHLLKVFATVEGSTVSGFAFFTGGGRPQEATLIVTDKGGHELYKGKTDARGAFSWTPPQPGALIVTIDAGDGHVAHSDIAADRFGVAQIAEPAAEAVEGSDPASTQSPEGRTVSNAPLASADMNAITAAVDRAVARQIRPLLEAIAEADGRARLNDIIGGVGMIFGLAGVAMWLTARRRIQSAASRPEKTVE